MRHVPKSHQQERLNNGFLVLKVILHDIVVILEVLQLSIKSRSSRCCMAYVYIRGSNISWVKPILAQMHSERVGPTKMRTKKSTFRIRKERIANTRHWWFKRARLISLWRSKRIFEKLKMLMRIWNIFSCNQRSNCGGRSTVHHFKIFRTMSQGWSVGDGGPIVLRQKLTYENHDVLYIEHVELRGIMDHINWAFWCRNIWSSVGEYMRSYPIC